jgi:hypothetical protein
MQNQRFYVGRHWKRWGVYDVLELRDPKVLSVHDDWLGAVAEAARMNAKEKR